MDFPDTDPDLYLELARDQLGYQLAAADAIESKTGTWFAVGSTLMGLLVALVALKPPRAAGPIALAVLATVSYLVMTVTTVVVLFGSGWGAGPDLRALENDRSANGWTATQTKWVAFAKILRNRSDNDTPYRRRLTGMRLIAVSLACQTLLLGWLALALATSTG